MEAIEIWIHGEPVRQLYLTNEVGTLRTSTINRRQSAGAFVFSEDKGIFIRDCRLKSEILFFIFSRIVCLAMSERAHNLRSGSLSHR